MVGFIWDFDLYTKDTLSKFSQDLTIHFGVGLSHHSRCLVMASSSDKEELYIHKFDGTNFTIWKAWMMDVLTNKGLIEHLYAGQENASYTDS